MLGRVGPYFIHGLTHDNACFIEATSSSETGSHDNQIAAAGVGGAVIAFLLMISLITGNGYISYWFFKKLTFKHIQLR